MEGRTFQANLAILNSMAKMVCRSKIRIRRYDRAAPTVKIEDPTVQD